MAARNPNFSTQYQNFLTESYHKERDARLSWFMKLKDQGKGKPERPKQLDVFRRKIEEGSKPSDALLSKVPKQPYEPRYNKKKTDFTDTMLEKATRLPSIMQDMRPVTPDVKGKLFDGFTKEGKGRYDYLRQRNSKNPEDKFNFPLVSSWEYGWRLGDVIPKEAIKKPQHGRTKIVVDTFYNRNGTNVPPVIT